MSLILVGYYKATQNAAEAARKENILPRTAQRIINRYLKTGSTKNLPRTGHPRLLTDADERVIIWDTRKHRRAPLQELANNCPVKLSISTVCRVLYRHGYHQRVARKVPYLSKQQKKERLWWAKLFDKYSMEDWSKIIWSDECYIYLGDNRGRIYVTRRLDERLEEDCLVPTFNQSTVRVMVWGCIMHGEKGPLIVLEYPGGKGGGMDSKRYREQVLEGVLLEYWKEMGAGKGDVQFQQDNAPSHQSKATKKWFATHGIKLFPHPASSPDVSPIEPVWHELKTDIRQLPSPPSTIPQLKAAVLAAWERLDVGRITKYTKTMPERVAAVKAAKGGHTQYWSKPIAAQLVELSSAERTGERLSDRGNASRRHHFLMAGKVELTYHACSPQHFARLHLLVRDGSVVHIALQPQQNRCHFLEQRCEIGSKFGIFGECEPELAGI
ncbi:hypothetical protein NMY22_g13113 [Coprinellus aureogranulatus]|nr:hypothetical protein NMY22_g13113 [Coprinellus aureogranulatus]